MQHCSNADLAAFMGSEAKIWLFCAPHAMGIIAMKPSAIDIIRIPVRFLVFLIGLLFYVMESSADWLIGSRRRTEYVRVGKCKQCGRCCRCLGLVMPERISKRNWMVRVANFWHTFAMNFNYLAEDEHWLVYRCGYYDDEAGCTFYPFRHRICRFYPRQKLYGYPSTHDDCGFKFVKREVFEKRKGEKKRGLDTFDDCINAKK